jgi:small-conductance mechanosensitive channel
MRSTTIRTNNNINIIVPNQSLVENNIVNWTLSDDIVRFKIPF